MSNFVFLLEEPSAKEMLKAILPKILENKYEYFFIVFEGKSDLEKNIVIKIRSWKRPNSKFIILRDRDSGNCYEIKKSLKEKCREAGREDCLIRIACCELESWYLGDLDAIEKGLNVHGISSKKNIKKYSRPDDLNNAAEELSKLTKNVYQKINGSRKIAPYLDPDNNFSKSFNVFINGLRKMGE